MRDLSSLERRRRPVSLVLERPLPASGRLDLLRGRLEIGVTRRPGQAQRGGELGHPGGDARPCRLCVGPVRRARGDNAPPCEEYERQERARGGGERDAEETCGGHARDKGRDNPEHGDDNGDKGYRDAGSPPERARGASQLARLSLRDQAAVLG